MQKPIVSIITPCYNGEKYIGRQIESVLKQTYRPIEYILINDGSTDMTEYIVLSYKKIFEQEGIKLIYIYQDNKGLGGAINTGLKIFKGDYFCWPDADDYLHPESIEKRVEFLEKNKEFAVVTSDADIFESNNLDNSIGFVSGKIQERFSEYQFELLLNEKSIFCPGCHMVRTDAFLDVNPNRDIYEAKRGQNWQILLPLYYKYKRGFIDEALYHYIIYPTSMSHGDETIEQEWERAEEHEKIIIETLNRIKMDEIERTHYKNYIRERYIRKKLLIACKYKDKQKVINQYKILKLNRIDNSQDLLNKWCAVNKFVEIGIKGYRKIRGLI